jgi:hypothetical protein
LEIREVVVEWEDLATVSGHGGGEVDGGGARSGSCGENGRMLIWMTRCSDFERDDLAMTELRRLRTATP